MHNSAQHSPATMDAASFTSKHDVEHLFFLSGCADFYQEIAWIKRAHSEGRLAQYLASDGTAPPVTAAEFALRVSARLYTFLSRQQHDYRRTATTQETEVHDLALYLMAAVADEIFILELDWPGCDAWLDVLIEHKLFKTRNAGTRFFQIAADLMRIKNRDPLHTDLAAVVLLSLALGFKGRYRGPQGEAALHEIRTQLFNLVNRNSHGIPQLHDRENAFAQAYQPLLQGGADERLAPLSPWATLGAYAALAYLVLSVVTWLILMHPVEQYFGG